MNQLLNRGLSTPFTLVSAPAGYGKSTLVSSWAETIDLPCAWFSLDSSDSQLRSFLTYLIEAIRQVEPDALTRTRELVFSPNPPETQVLGGYLINEIAELESPFVLVLDDYHRIGALSEVHELVRLLLDHPPRPLRLILIGRKDPPLPLESLRGGQAMSEVRLGDLEFSGEEVNRFLAAVANLEVSEASLANLRYQTEGWAAGLQMVALHLMHIKNAENFLLEMNGGIQWTQEYLVKEVLANQVPVLQEFLLRASILDRFCAGLIDAVGSQEGPDFPGVLFGHQFMEMLKTGNLFIIALDDQGEWFRYHHLFQEILQEQLKSQKSLKEIAELHLRASEWFQKQSHISEAIEHALKAGQPELAARIVAHHRHDEFTQDRSHVVAGWLDLLPEDVKHSHPEILMTEAWAAYYRIQVERAVLLVAEAETRIKDQEIDPALQAEILFFRGYGQYWEGDPTGSQETFEAAQAILGNQESFCAAEIEIHLALARAMGGKKEQAVQALKEKIQGARTHEGLYLPHLNAALAFVDLISGDLHQCRLNARRLGHTARKNKTQNTEAWGSFLEGSAYLHSGDFENAIQHFGKAVDKRFLLDAPAAVDAFAGLALAQQLLHLDGEASRTRELLDTYAAEVNCPACMAAAESSLARLAILRGDMTAAVAWSQAPVTTPSIPELFLWLEVPAITRARVMIAEGTENSLQKASALLQEMFQESEKYRFTGQVIEVMVLQSMVQDQLGQPEEALRTLAEVLVLAEPLGWVRPFVESGGVMVRMLQRLAERVDDKAFILRLLSACVPETKTPGMPSATVFTPGRDDILDELTNRERDVLGLLARRFQNKEIADQLCISTHTVNFHLKQVYQKLDVHNRRQAVDRALELGLINHH